MMSELIDRANADMQPEANTKSLVRTLPTKIMNELLNRIAELEMDKAEADKLLNQVYDDICCGSTVTKPTEKKILARERAKP